MALLKTNVLFPIDFEEAYNKLHRRPAYSGGASTGLVMPFDEDNYRKSVQFEEKKVGLKRSITHPRSRLYTQVTARGGDIQSPEARRLLPKILSKRADDYRKLAGIEVPSKEGVSEMSPSKALSIEVDKLLTLMLTQISAGLFNKDVIESGNEVLQLLLKDGNILSKNQLNYLYRAVSDLYDNLYYSTARQEGIVTLIPPEDKKTFRTISTLVDTIGRTIRAILSRSELSSAERKLYQKSVKENATKFIKKNAKILGKIRQGVSLTPKEEEEQEDIMYSRRGNFPEVMPFVPLKR